MSALLSKSKYLTGLQCPKLLWYSYNEPEKIPKPDAAKQAIFDAGHLVGDYAKLRYPGGVEVLRAGTLQDTVADTQELLPQRKPIFEASFLADQLYCRVDVLVPAPGANPESGAAANDTWDLVEVKSATSVKPVNIEDVAFQAHCLERSGIKLNRLYLMHVDNRFVRDGDIDPDALLHAEDVTTEARSILPEVPDAAEELLGVIDGAKPDIPIGPNCTAPYGCDLKAHCWSFLPDHDVTELYKARTRTKFDLIDDGILALADVPAERLNDKHRIQQDAVVTGEPHVEPDPIRDWLSRLTFPLYCLDFETMNPAVPLVDGTRPYQQVPFQFSLHVLDAFDSEPMHFEYLATNPGDPRPDLIEGLREIGPEGTILAYYMGFERGVLNDLGNSFPEHREFLADLAARLDDLLIPFRSFWYYHPDQRGSCSLKAVLPALTGKSYEGLAIQDGKQAAREFQHAVYGDATDEEREQTLADLSTYCRQDTEAMVDILDALRALV
jgi:hypothetical protein